MKVKEMQDIANTLIGKKISEVKVNITDSYSGEANELNIILNDGTEIEIGASWNEDGEFHLYVTN
jgi:hypothetical protein